MKYWNPTAIHWIVRNDCLITRIDQLLFLDQGVKFHYFSMHLRWFHTRCPGWLCFLEAVQVFASDSSLAFRLGSLEGEKLQDGAIIFCSWLSERKLDKFSGRNVSLTQSCLYSLSFPLKSPINLGFQYRLILFCYFNIWSTTWVDISIIVRGAHILVV